MRITVRVEDELLEQLKARARVEKVSLTHVLNRTLKAGIKARSTQRPAQRIFREQVHALGTPRTALDKALALTDSLENEEVVRALLRPVL